MIENHFVINSFKFNFSIFRFMIYVFIESFPYLFVWLHKLFEQKQDKNPLHEIPMNKYC